MYCHNRLIIPKKVCNIKYSTEYRTAMDTAYRAVSISLLISAEVHAAADFVQQLKFAFTNAFIMCTSF